MKGIGFLCSLRILRCRLLGTLQGSPWLTSRRLGAVAQIALE